MHPSSISDCHPRKATRSAQLRAELAAKDLVLDETIAILERTKAEYADLESVCKEAAAQHHRLATDLVRQQMTIVGGLVAGFSLSGMHLNVKGSSNSIIGKELAGVYAPSLQQMLLLSGALAGSAIGLLFLNWRQSDRGNLANMLLHPRNTATLFKFCTAGVIAAFALQKGVGKFGYLVEAQNTPNNAHALLGLLVGLAAAAGGKLLKFAAPPPN